MRIKSESVSKSSRKKIYYIEAQQDAEQLVLILIKNGYKVQLTVEFEEAKK